MPDWTLRSAISADAAALARSIDAAYASYAERLSDLPRVSEGIAEDIHNHSVWVVEAEGAVVGGLVLIITETCGILANVAVAPGHGGQGIGRALIDCAIQETLERGLRDLRLSTHAEMPENVRLYEKLGWQVTEISGNKVHMTKPLTL